MKIIINFYQISEKSIDLIHIFQFSFPYCHLNSNDLEMISGDLFLITQNDGLRNVTSEKIKPSIKYILTGHHQSTSKTNLGSSGECVYPSSHEPREYEAMNRMQNPVTLTEHVISKLHDGLLGNLFFCIYPMVITTLFTWQHCIDFPYFYVKNF